MVDRIDPSGDWCPSTTVVCKPISYRCFSFVRCVGKNEKAKVMQGLKDVYGKTLGTVTVAEYLGIHGIANRLTKKIWAIASQTSYRNCSAGHNYVC